MPVGERRDVERQSPLADRVDQARDRRRARPCGRARESGPGSRAAYARRASRYGRVGLARPTAPASLGERLSERGRRRPPSGVAHARPRPSMSQVPSPTTRLPAFSASAISDSVPYPPPTAISASAARTTSALRASPRPVGIATSTKGFAAARSSPAGCRPSCRRPPWRRGRRPPSRRRARRNHHRAAPRQLRSHLLGDRRVSRRPSRQPRSGASGPRLVHDRRGRIVRRPRARPAAARGGATAAVPETPRARTAIAIRAVGEDGARRAPAQLPARPSQSPVSTSRSTASGGSFTSWLSTITSAITPTSERRARVTADAARRPELLRRAPRAWPARAAPAAGPATRRR